MTKEGTSLGTLQGVAEVAAKRLKAAQKSYNTAKNALERAEVSYTVAQKSLIAGVEQVKAATKV